MQARSAWSFWLKYLSNTFSDFLEKINRCAGLSSAAMWTYRSTAAFLCLLAVYSPARAQSDPTLEAGVVPYRSYVAGQFDSVDALNGNVLLHIPLASFPQRGGVELSFSLIANSSMGWRSVSTEPCGGVTCTSTGLSAAENGSPRIIEDHYIVPTFAFTYQHTNETTFFTYIPAVLDAYGARHPMGYDASNLSYIRSTDGAGYLYVPANPSFYKTFDSDYPVGTLYTSDGVSRTYSTQGAPGSALQAMSDPDGNTITHTFGSTTDSAGDTHPTGTYQDTLGRSISDPVLTTEITNSSQLTSSSGCPNISASNQPLTGSVFWSAPGPNGSTQTYQFCYATVYVSTSTRATSYSQGIQQITALQSVVLPNKTYWAFIYDSADPSGNGSGLGGITQVITPTGGSVSYTYTSNRSCDVASDTTTTNLAVLTRTTNDGQGHTYSWSYNYATGSATLPNGASAATATTTVTDPLMQQTVYNYQAPQSESCNLLEMSRQTYTGSAGSSQLLSNISTNYQYADNPQNALQTVSWLGITGVFPMSTTTTIDGVSTTTSKMQYDSGFSNEQPVCFYTGQNQTATTCQSSEDGSNPPVQIPLGKVTSRLDYDYGSGSAGALLRTTNTLYQAFSSSAYLNADLLNLPASVQVVDGNGAQVASTQYQYDQSGYVASTASPLGHLTTTSEWISGSTYATSHSWWNGNGTLNKGTDPNGLCATTYIYSPAYNGAYPTGITNCLNQTTSYAYDVNTGQETKVTDSNQQTTTYTYNDPLGRITAVNDPDGGATNYQYNDMASPPNVMISEAIASTAAKSNEIIVDGFGRQIATKVLSDPSGTVEVDSTYDGLGRVQNVSNPYRSTSDSTYGLTSYTYDVLNRPTGLTNPDGTTQGWMYTGNTTAFTNESGIVWDRSYDALGRLTQVKEPDPSDTNAPTTETDYQYDALDDLTRVDQWGGPSGSAGDRVRMSSYDGLARLTSATNPESGTISYYYTTAANALCAGSTSSVCRRQDARGITTTYSYDALSRLIGKSYQNDPTTTSSVTYVYDAPISGWNFVNQTSPSYSGMQQTNLVSRLSYEYNGSATTVFSYDALGRTVLRSVCTPSTCGSDHYDFHASYDLAGDLTFADRGLDAVRNAASPGAGYYYGGLTMGYNTAAQLQSAQSDIVDAAHPQSILANLTYVPSGQVYTAELGAQYGQVSGYDKRFHLQDRASVNLSGDTVLADHWDYNSVGTMKDQNDSAQGEFQYSYDNLNRVTNAAIPPFTEAYGYDAWGNQTYHTVMEGQSYQWSFMPTAQNQASNPGVVYDAAGNMTADGLHYYTYDAENRITAVTDQQVNYAYDPEGMRVAALSGGAVTAEYLYDTAGDLVTTVNNAGSLVRSILRDNNGRHWGDFIGVAGSGGLRTEFRLVNAVGTLVANGDTQGNFIEGCLSGPFGDGQDCTPGYDYTETHFADKLRDSATNDDYFDARYFNSIMGRFVSADFNEDGDDPDPVPYADFTNPQSLNLYSYAYNNPLINTDADGHLPCGGSATIDITVTPNGSSASQTPDCYSTPSFSFGPAIKFVRNTANVASQAANQIADVITTPGGLGCLANLTASGASAGAVIGGGVGLVGLAGGGVGVVATEPAGLIAGGIGGGASGAALAMTVCPGGAANGGGGAGRASGSEARLNKPQQRQTAKYLGLKEVKGLTSQGQAVFEKDGRYFSFSNTSHVDGEVFKELDRSGERIATTDINFNRVGP